MISVACYQGAPKSPLEERFAQVEEILSQTDNQKIDFLCLPEGFLTGYYEEANHAFANCLTPGSQEFEAWLELFKKSSTTAIVGFNELEGDKLFDSAAIIEGGRLLGVQRKHFLYHSYFTSGKHFQVYHSKNVPFGVAICLDTNYFEPARLLALQGAQIIFSPMCNKVAPTHPFATRPPYYSHFVARSFENRLWLASADWVYPSDGSLVCPGHSAIYDPDGKEVARGQEMHSGLFSVEIPESALYADKGRRLWGSPELFSALLQAFI